MEIIPAVDIRGGKCVRLEQGEAARETVYAADPVEAARRWQSEGARRLHVVDLDGAFSGAPANANAVRGILKAVKIPTEIGGGIRDFDTVKDYLDSGAAWAVMGTRAAEEPEVVGNLSRLLPGRIILGLDCKDGRVRVAGWVEGGALTPEAVIERLAGAPLAAVIYTNIARDGMLAGPDFEGLARVQKASPWPVIASGGVSTAEQVRRLAGMNLAGAIVGQALYKGTMTLAQAMDAARGG